MSFTSVYYDLLRSVMRDPEHVSKPRGLEVREKLCYKFTLTNPRDRLPYLHERNYSLSYFVAESLWYLAGLDSTEWISRYSAFWKKISDDGVTANSAYGARIFKRHNMISSFPAGNDWNQWDYVIDELRRDPDSRRAVIHIRVPQDSYLASLDVPCTLSLQFFLRNDELHMVVSMRSSDALLGIGNDIPAFTIFQELMTLDLSEKLGKTIKLGSYMHVSNSLHIYEKDYETVNKIISSTRPMGSMAMPPMPGKPPVEQLLYFEHEVRQPNADIVRVLDANSSGIDYWDDWMKLLASHWANKRGDVQLQQSLISSTSFQGYHFFSR